MPFCESGSQRLRLRKRHHLGHSPYPRNPLRSHDPKASLDGYYAYSTKGIRRYDKAYPPMSLVVAVWLGLQKPLSGMGLQ